MDVFSPEQRSEIMRRVHSKDTQPEVAVRKLLREGRYRYQVHSNGLPGKPDLVFPRRKKVIFIHGCFWHRHPDCALARLPKSRLAFWLPKLNENRQRDLRNIRRLRKLGW